MAEALASQTTKTVEELSAPRKFLTSSLLVLLTVIVAGACVVLLSVTLTQTRVSTLVIDGGNIGIRKLDYVGRKWARLLTQIEITSTQLTAKREKTDELVARVTVTDAEQKAKFKDTDQLLAGFYFRVLNVDEKLADRIHAKGHETQVGNILAARDKLVEKSQGLGPIIDSIEKAYGGFRGAERSATAAKADLKANEDEIRALGNQLQFAEIELDKQFNLIKPGLGADKDTRPHVENAFYELNINNFDCGIGNDRCGWIGGPVSRGLYLLLTLRPDLLTLMLVILMGVLGSALQISHAFFMKNQAQTIGGYFQRISVGAMTALVIFIVAKAGVPVIADPARLGGDAAINPYFVSFLAIVSGLLSENAITNIQAQGAKLFGGGTTEAVRWVREDLTSELETEKITIQQLSAHLQKDDNAVKSMIKGEKEIEPAQQKVIALLLRKPMRDLFSDIPPTRA